MYAYVINKAGFKTLVNKKTLWAVQFKFLLDLFANLKDYLVKDYLALKFFAACVL